MEKTVIIANISYNPTGWRQLYRNPKGNHSYTLDFPGHESLNFKFDKPNIDSNENIFGYVHWTMTPKKFKPGGVIIFYSNNTELNTGQIVGIYCDAKVLNEEIVKKWKGFENDEVWFNIKANKSLSLLFPIPLDADNYKSKKSKRLVGQIGFSYYDMAVAKRIIKDEYNFLAKGNILQSELITLSNIYSYITGQHLYNKPINNQKEQDELISSLNQNREDIINELTNLKETDPETIIVNQKKYKRDNKTIAQIKFIRNFKCQICGYKLKKKKGGHYIEAAHIIPKKNKGRETPDNILILCPNHHKEFDYGDREILEHDKKHIVFRLNSKIHDISLNLK